MKNKTNLNPDYFVVYCWTFLPNGSQYIGKTKRFEKRITEHIRGRDLCKRGHKTFLHRSIEKYGLENFTLEILKECDSKEEMHECELSYIREYNTLHPNGFNLVENNGTYDRKEETLDKIKKYKQGIKRKKDRKYIGVAFRNGSYITSINIDGECRQKAFKTETLAAEGYDRMCLKIYGENAILNFPEKRQEYLSEDLNAFYKNFATKKQKMSKFKWILYCDGRWMSRPPKNNIMPPFKNVFFDSDIEAAEFSDMACRYYLGVELHDLNFPEKLLKTTNSQIKEFLEPHIFIKTNNYCHIVFKKRCPLNPWYANINFKGKQLNLGYYKDEAEAVKNVQIIKEEISSSAPDFDKIKCLNIPQKTKDFLILKLTNEILH